MSFVSTGLWPVPEKVGRRPCAISQKYNLNTRAPSPGTLKQGSEVTAALEGARQCSIDGPDERLGLGLRD